MYSILHIGAGQANELDQWLVNGAQSIVLVEPNPVLAEQLRQKTVHQPQVRVVEVAVTPALSHNQLNEYNVPGVSSLRAATGLKVIFPGLQIVNTYVVETRSPEQLLKEYGPSGDQEAVLIIAAAGEEQAILQALIASDQLKAFSQIEVTVGVEPLYEGAASKQELLTNLQDYGYEITKESQPDPDSVKLQLQRNPLKDQATLAKAREEIERLKVSEQKTVKALEKSLAKKKDELTQSKKELKQIQASLQEHKVWLKNCKEQAEKLEAALAQEKEKNQKLVEQKEQLIADQSQSKEAMSPLEARMEQLFSQQASQIQQAANVLGKHVTQSFLHQRQHYQSVTGLHQYLENGEQPLSFGSWAIDTELAVHLVRAIEQNNYDLIIEFGSGTSTALMARAVFNTLTAGAEISESESLSLEYEETQAFALTKQKKGRREGKSKALTLNEYDLPRRILSFEQDRAYQQQTKATLTAQGLANLVELVLAPLVPTRLSQQAEQNILFYDCEKHLARIASLYENKQARILVLVDGPISPKNNPLIREPALANVLQYLSAHHLDVVLNDSNREGEQQVVELWRDLCEERGLSWQEEDLGTEKGALWLTVRT